LPGKLYLCATPIGNLKDITVRVLDTLKEVDIIAAEDTRHTRKLLTHYGIKKPLISFHDQNEIKALPRLIEELRRGKKVAQVSDAGMPGIADPGHRLIKACVEAGIDVEILPGPSASLTAAVLSAFPTDDIRFLGYLPKKAGPRRRLLEEVKAGPSTLVFYESPRRILETLSDLASTLDDRRVFIARELTKLFEEHLRGTAVELAARLSERPEIKGEIVLVVEGRRDRDRPELDEIIALVDREVAVGRKKSEVVKEIAARYGISRRLVYEATHGGEKPDRG
jgi:16S rRNA (cytidine1402-2'-O)-methyltransferase